MNPRRAATAAMAASVLGAVVLFTAPGALAAPTASGTASLPTGKGDAGPGAGEEAEGAGDTPPATPSTAPTDSDTPGTGSPSPTTPGTPSDAASPGPGGEDDPTVTVTPTPTRGRTDPGTDSSPRAWDTGDCTGISVDPLLSVAVEGLPRTIAAGSGWHPFTFSVHNRTGHALDDVYVQAITEYEDGVNERASLQLDLAEMQFRNPADGTWTDAFQDWYEDRGDRHTFPGTFVSFLPHVDAGATAALALRVRVAAEAPPGASFVLTSAVYAGADGDCRAGGDTHGFAVGRPGTQQPPGHQGGGASAAGPSGAVSPTPKSAAGPVPLSDAADGGSLAATGTPAALPALGVCGGLAVALGGAAVFGARRRRG
ncbi:hypothetical protein [Streptomyces sp. NPDC050560]|uniref:hypothetical protein n=1 Tax=Streptomyces sp. NPDC050560 TaxID=3365630 RepID=UPI00378C376D